MLFLSVSHEKVHVAVDMLAVEIDAACVLAEGEGRVCHRGMVVRGQTGGNGFAACFGIEAHGGVLKSRKKHLSAIAHVDGRSLAAAHRLRRAKAYIDGHFAEPVTVEMLAALCHMSDTHFRREWQRAYGETVMAYRDRVCLTAARAFLLDGYLSVTETAEKCGFADVSYFVRFFKKKTGITPAAFRRGNAAF